MSKEFKRLLTLLVTAAMLFSMMPMGVVAQEEIQNETETQVTQTDTDIESLEPVADSEDVIGDVTFTDETTEPGTTAAETDGIDVSNATELVEQIAADAVVLGNGELTMFRFVPGESGTYSFTSLANAYGNYDDTWAELYDANGNALTHDDDSGNYNSFMITYALTAGEVYYLGVRFWDSYTAGSFQVQVFRFQVASLSVEPMELEDHVDGYLSNYWDGATQGRFYLYDWWEWLSFTVTMENGDVIQGENSRFCYNGIEFQLQYENDQGPTNLWTVGNTYQVNVSVGGVSATTSITITPCTIASVVFSPVSFRENTGGNLQMGWDEEDQCEKEYYEYYWWNQLSYTVTFTDGNTVECGGTSFYYNGKNYNLEYLDPQNVANIWTVGNTYSVEVMLGAVTVSVPVTIAASNIASIQAEPVTVAEGANGGWHGQWNSETGSYVEYFRYYWWDNLTCQVTFTDGTIITVNGSVFDYNGEEYRISCMDDQGAYNTWTAGNTYTAQVSLDSATSELSVTVEASPIASINVYPLTMMENTCGGITNEWDPETQTDVQYYRYWWWNEFRYDVIFTDGTMLTDRGGSYFTYNGVGYNLSTSDNQNASNIWTVGNTYEETVSVGGVSATVQITIEGSPIAELRMQPVTVPASGGWLSSMYNPETGRYDQYIYIYGWENYACYDVVLRDGTVLTGLSGSSFEYNGQYYYLNRQDGQYETPWAPGNTYQAQAEVSGVLASVTVTVAPSPFASVSVAPVTIVENTGGGMTTDWNYVTQQDETYYRYYWNSLLPYTITYVDGNIYTGTGGGVLYNGQYYSFATADSQSFAHWTVGNTYTVTAYLCGVRCEVSVTIVESPVQSVTVEPIVIEENVNGYYSWDANGSYFYYNQWYQNVRFTILLKDGTALEGAYGQHLFVEGQSYYVESWGDNQQGEHWYAGNTYEATVTIGGQDYPVQVTVCAATENNGFEYLVQNGQVIITGCTTQTTLLQIPETINGYPVVGVTGLGDALLYAEEIRFPDSVRMLSASLFERYGEELPLKKLYIGSGISSLTQDSIYYLNRLEWIEVSPNNPYYTGIDGAVYDKEVTTLLMVPAARKDTLVVPDSVTNVENLFFMSEEAVLPDIQLGSGVTDYKMVDGVIYNADMTGVIMATASAAGSYVMPDSVEWISMYAFSGSKLTSVTLSNNVTSITYGTFFNSPLLEEITVPSSVVYVEPEAFRGCDSLAKVHISDVAAWSKVMFWTEDSNPLYYAHDLYLDGEKVTELVIPEALEQEISQYAFSGGSFTSVTVPSNVLAIGMDAFAGCTNLQKVNITDLAAWSSTIFGSKKANPLYYAHDLYLNGEKVTQLVLPETVANRAYPQDCGIGVGKYAFVGASIETVTVPSYIQSIGMDAFAGCDSLTQVHVEDLAAWAQTEFQGLEANPLYYAHDLYLGGEKVTELVLPETVGQTVYAYAFAGGSMTSLTVPSGVYYIASYAFAETAVEELFLAQGLNAIGFAAFQSSAVKDVALPDTLSWIGDSAFELCEDLQSVSFGSNLSEIGWYAFSGTGVQSVVLPDSLTWMGEGAFMDCTSLQELTIGSGLTSIADAAFQNTALTALTVPQQVTQVGMDAFRDSAVAKLNIESEKLTIVWGAFANCPIEGTLELGENVTYMGGEAFSGIQATQVKLPATAVMLSYREFAFNDNLVSVTLSAGTEYIGKYAFMGSNNISHVLYTGTGEQWDTVYCESDEINNATLHTGAAGNEVTTEQTCTTIQLYCSICQQWETVKKNRATHTFDEDGVCTVCQHDEVWEYEIDEAAGTVTVTDYTGGDVHVQMPDEIEGLPVAAFTAEVFANDHKLLSVVLPETVTQIPDGAFYGCFSLEEVTMGSQITSVGNYAFYGCENLRKAALPDTVLSIGDFAFQNCYRLQMKALPASLKRMGESAFGNCRSISLRTLPEGVTDIAYAAFAGCTSLQQIVLPESVTNIVYRAFKNCYSLRQVTIGENVISMGDGIFRDCMSLDTICFLGEKPDIADAAIQDGVTVFYPATESWADTQRDKWYACQNPVITEQPANVQGWLGDEIVVAVDAEGQRLRYQWYLAASGSDTYEAVGSNSPELPLVLTEANSGSSAYCVITDVLGQTAQTEKVTLSGEEKPVMQITTLPTKLDYLLGEELDNTGMVVTLTWADGTVQTLESYDLTGFDPNTAGEQIITVSYNGLTAAYTVTVTDPYSGSCGENLSWRLDGGVLTISGTGVMNNYTTTTQPWKAFRSTITTLVVEEGVTALGNYAFYYCRKITEATLPASLTTVKIKTFYKTEALTDVYYGGTAEQWSAVSVAADNDPLTAATLHTTEVVTGIDIVFGPDKTVYIQGEALDTTGMELTVTWSNGTVETVTEGFGVSGYDPELLGEQTVSVYYRGVCGTFTVTVEAEEAVLVSVEVTTPPVKWEYQQGEELDTTGMIVTATWSDGSTVMITDGFAIADYDPNVIGEQTVSVYYSGMRATFTVTVKMPAVEGTCGENLTWILDGGTLTISGTGAMTEFENDDRQPWYDYRGQIVNVVIEEGVTSIGFMAFYSCSGIESVEIPASVSTIASTAFFYTQSMTGFQVADDSPYFSADENGFLFNSDKSELVQAVRSVSGCYMVPEGVMGIGKDAFATCFDLTDVIFPGTLQGIGDGAFSACWELTSITLPDNVTRIGENAFSDCSSLAVIDLSENLTTIGACAFSYCVGLTAVTIPEQVTTIGVMAFIGCDSIVSITLPASITEIGSLAFRDCLSLTDVYYQGSAEQWAQISIGSGNEPLTNATIHFAKESVTLTGITVTPPAKTEYWVAEDLNTEGMTVTATYSDGTTAELTEGYTLEGYDPYTAGEQVITVTYEGFTATFTVTVSEQPVPEPEFVRIDVTAPEKTLYWVGEELDLTGMVVTALYSDQSTQVITEGYTVSGFDSTTPGEKQILITYKDSSDIFVITVEEKLINEQVGQVIIDDSKGVVGRTVDVKLTLQNNPGIASMKLKIHFDSSVLTLTEVLDGGILGENAHKPEMTSPYTLSWVNDLATENFTENGVLVTLRFTIAEDAPEGVYTITATYDADMGDIMDKDLVDVEMEIISGSVDVITVLLGDVNGDGEINARDRAILTRYLSDWEGYADQVDMQAADVNQDGVVNARDRAILTRYLADWEGYTQLPYSG